MRGLPGWRADHLGNMDRHVRMLIRRCHMRKLASLGFSVRTPGGGCRGTSNRFKRPPTGQQPTKR